MMTEEEVAELVGELPANDIPLALFPVQVQTRFAGLDGQPQLLVRVYPDEVHVDSHEAGLTGAEVRWGRAYWELIWPAAGDEPVLRAAWERLADRFGARRAAWVARRMAPTNLDVRPAAAPAFPDPGPPRDDEQFAPAFARLLPDRWIVSGYRGGERVVLEVGAPIPRPLPAGLGADETPAPEVGDGELPIDPRIQWMVDFDAAEAVGMAVRVGLGSADVESGLDLLAVFGVRTTTDPAAGAAELAAVLDAHHYTRGLSFLAPGAPTNNTAAASTGYSRRDPDPHTSFGVEVRPPRVRAGDDGGLAARALGVATELFAAVDGAALTEDRDARHLLTALWSVTGGYYLGHLTGASPDEPEPFTYGDLDSARRFVIDYVRPQGPLPTLRIGRQPYGLLPVTSLDRMAGPTPDGPGPFLINLRRLRDQLWKPALARAPRLVPGRQDDENLVEILRMQPASVGYRARLAYGRQTFIPGFLPDDVEPELLQHRLQLAIRLAQIGVSAEHWRMFDIIPAGIDRLLPDESLQPGGAAEYLSFLRTASFDDVLREAAPPVLLHRLLRHSVLLAQSATGHRILVRRGQSPDGVLHEPVLVDTNPPSTTVTLSRVLDRDPELRARMHTIGEADEPEAAVLEELRASLEHLAAVPEDRLARHLAGCLDLYAYRLDAWITALATRQLQDLRRTRPRGLAIGGFGWVEDLRPAPRTPLAEPPPGEQAPVFAATEPGGHLFAPSMSQAAAAAVLRSGFLADVGEGDARPFAIDLRSDRVRLAAWLLDGVRDGQPLGELLGYRFERGLHERGLDRFIAGFRRVSMLADAYEAPDATRRAQALAAIRQRYGWPATATIVDLERLAEGRIADGLALARHFQAGTIPHGRVQPAPSAAERQRLDRELAAVDAALDAVSDALTAESVYQLVRGNPARAAATVDAVANGEIAPPELQVVQTPRTGTPLTHRLAVLLPRPERAAPPAGARQARAAAEPALGPWLRQLLGEVAQVRFGVEFLDGDELVHAEDRIPLSRFGLSHVDVMHFTAAAQPGQPADLERLLDYELRRAAPEGIPATARVQLAGERDPDLPPGQLGLTEYLECLRPVREMVLAARGIEGRDLTPEPPPESGVDIAELRERADAAVGGLAETLAELIAAQQAVANAPDDLPAGQLAPLLDALRERLLDLAFFGVPAAIPVSARGGEVADRAALLAQAGAVEQAAADRLARVDSDAEVPAEQRLAHERDRLRAVFGDGFRVLPLVRPPNGDELALALQASTQVQDGDPLQVHSWLLGVARVRPSASRLQAALAFAAAFGRPAGEELRVAQLPHEPGVRWTALPSPEGYPPGTLSLVVHAPAPIPGGAPLAGLLVDDWVEIVPAAEVTAGLAFHHEAPGARPPQSILLATAPSYLDRWSVEILERTLRETLDLARLRILDPQVLSEDPILHRGLPALYVSVNVAGEALSTDFIAEGGAG